MHKNHEIVITQLRIESLLEGNNFYCYLCYGLSIHEHSVRGRVSTPHTLGHTRSSGHTLFDCKHQHPSNQLRSQTAQLPLTIKLLTY